MYLGKLVEIAETDEIFRNPRHPYTQVLLAANPVPDPHKTMFEPDEWEMRSGAELVINTGCVYYSRCPKASKHCASNNPELIGSEHAVACFLI
jgi:peptide/nickel transport system ATP-binding protein/oligopeptide transport system ATP-binding protein